MAALSDADTIRILVATDNHVGYNERDHIRGNDSWKAFHEVMCLAKERDVDMVLLAGDLFHDNKPSANSMCQVMRSLRMNCLGEKPCELEMLSDASENFQGAFNHVNFEDLDINVAIPVFSIHGNHDDPSGQGHLSPLDLLQMSGLVNYYGRTPESDNIVVKPVLLQKGRTKLALYGMSNVRDERLFRTFRDGKVRIFRPDTQQQDWYNLMAVHQNHHAHTETGYLPENFLPDFLDMVIWGHEHECLISPRYNTEMKFHVMQPGSSVATSLVPGEAETKHVAILSISGLHHEVEPIRLKTVRPFVMREIILSEEKDVKHLAKKDNNRSELTRYLEKLIYQLIEEANSQWAEAHEDSNEDEDDERPLPLVRLRVEYSAPDGGKFECENPQRFSNRFVDKVANVNDVVQFYRKKAGTARRAAATEAPEESIMAQLSIDTVKIETLVREFLAAQSLTILPGNSFGDAVRQFVDKDDKHAMEAFVLESLTTQVAHLMSADDGGRDNDLEAAMTHQRSKLEELFAAGRLNNSNGVRTVAATTRKAAPATKKPATRKPSAGQGRGQASARQVVSEDEEPDDDVMMLDDNDDDDDGAVSQAPPPPPPTTRSAGTPRRAAASTQSAPKQSKLTFSSQRGGRTKAARPVQVVDDDISDDVEDDEDDDDDDAFDPAPVQQRSGRTARSRR
ncbi:MAG: Double-strand break repair protein mus-23 [Sarcosagium campestre]|nr:MAG: Double-strand break repair protein mus-23 [Sarcosagium campestre]